jgi:hypothetical protein
LTDKAATIQNLFMPGLLLTFDHRQTDTIRYKHGMLVLMLFVLEILMAK